MSLSLFSLLAIAAFAGDDEPSATSDHIAGVRVDVHANVSGYGLLGAGLRADLSLIHDGLLAGVDDELALSPGIDAFFAPVWHHTYQGGAYWVPSCVLQWSFYFGARWSIFPEAGLALYMGDGDYMPRGRPVYAALDLGFGVRYAFNSRDSLLLRVSEPTGLQVGVTF